MSNKSIELHDSSIESISKVEDQLFLFIKAYIHQSDGIPGIDKGTGWTQAVVISFYDASFSSKNKEYPIDISDGELLVGQKRLSNLIPIPFIGESIELKLELINGEEIVLSSQKAEIILLGNPKYIEEFLP